jgi:hypothetical protein
VNVELNVEKQDAAKNIDMSLFSGVLGEMSYQLVLWKKHFSGNSGRPSLLDAALETFLGVEDVGNLE